MIGGLSWQDQYTLFQQLTSDADATNLTMGKTLIRQGQRKVEAILGIYFDEESRTFTTKTDAISGTSSQSYKLPENFKALTALYVTVGSTRYNAELIQNEDLWQQICANLSSTSNYIQFCFIRRDRVEFYPIPSSACTATIIYRCFTKPLVADDYTTGTITTLANGAVAVTASGSTFTSAMAGRYFKVNNDGQWYKIASFGTTTTLTLDSKYQGISIAAGTEAYTIGQMPITPPETHELPVYFAVWRWALMKKDVQLAREYERMWKEGIGDAMVNWSNRSSSSIITGHRGLSRGVVKQNWWPEGMT